MKQDEEIIAVPGFGFYQPELWSIFKGLRENHSDSEVCAMLSIFWESGPEIGTGEFCSPQWDGAAACIPSARRGEVAVLPCIESHVDKDNVTHYVDTAYNITKRCLEDGTWEDFTNYTECLDHSTVLTGPNYWEDEFVFLLGYSVSIISLLFAIFIFMFFREMRCLRHKIHLNLFISVLSANLAWVLSYAITHFMITFQDDHETLTNLSTINCILTVLLRYFHLTNFFWMFVEGLYLFLQVQASFSVGRLKLRHCVSIGWGAPLLLTLLWTLLIYCQAQSEAAAASWAGHQAATSIHHPPLCPFMVESDAARSYDLYAYIVPVCLLLMFNFGFSIWIMAVVISKLRSTDLLHTTSQNINLRAAKALIIIVPVLGITYIFTIVGPQRTTTTMATVFILTRNVLLSFQGFFITLPYCFLNSEVCTMVKSHWGRWRDRNNIGYGPASARNSIAMQGMFSVNDARKRSSYGYHTVTTVTTVTDDRRGTLGQETEVVPRPGSVRAGSGPGHQSPPKPHKPWKPLDGPLVAAPQPDLVQHSQGVDRETTAAVAAVQENISVK